MSRESQTTIFGYGSLLDDDSRRATVPNARNVQPAYIKGFRREFSLLDAEGWKSNNLDLAGIPFCAVDITADGNGGAVNGIVFEVDADYFAALQRREHDYDLIETTVYDFESSQSIGQCQVFSGRNRDGQYRFGEPAQERYLEVCLAAAKGFGNAFYREFLATTYLDGQPLAELPELLR